MTLSNGDEEKLIINVWNTKDGKSNAKEPHQKSNHKNSNKMQKKAVIVFPS